MPPGIFSYIWRTSRWHQIGLSILSVAGFLLALAPLELQRRIVNGALGKQAIDTVVWLCVAYAALGLVAGGLKLGLNVYRGWVGEATVRKLRETVHRQGVASRERDGDPPDKQGETLAVVVAEVEPVGGFAGLSLSEPILQGGVMLSLFAYMLLLQPWIALLSFVLFGTQLLFVPLMQAAITRRARSRIETIREISGAMIDDGKAPISTTATTFNRQITTVFGLNMQILRLKYVMNFLMNLTNHLGITGVLLVGGWYVSRDEIDVGTIVAFISGLMRLNDPWGDLVNYFREMSVASAKYELIRNVFAAPREIASEPPAGLGRTGAHRPYLQ
jgi:ABC-type multidrug transport system fused ATPase/permease subunit